MRFPTVVLCSFLLCILVLVACSSPHKVDIEKLSNITVFYTDSDNQTQSADFATDSSELSSVKTWLKDNKKGWENYVASPPMGDILITSQNISLNIGNDWIILRQSNGSDNVNQLKKTLSSSDLEYFKTLR